MGVSMYDKEGSQRRLEALYVLTTAEGVEELLTMWDKLVIMPFDRGDYGVVDLIVDTQIAIRQANLTFKQWQAIELALMQGYTHQEVADVVGVDRTAITKLIARGTARIAEVFERWTKQGDY